MQIILDTVLPVFGVVLVGYFATRAHWFDDAAIKGLSLFAFSFAIPMMLFRSMARTELPDAVPWGFLLSYYSSAFSIWALAMLAGGALFKRKLDGMVMVGLCACFGNSVMIGVPLVLTTFGEVASVPMFLIIAFRAAVFLSVGTLLLELARGSRDGLRRLPGNILHGMATNPIIVGLALGFSVALSGFSLPGPVDRIANLIAVAAAPASLFAMGATLTQYRVAGNLPESSLLVVLKLVAQPLLYWVYSHYVFEVDPFYAKVGLLMAALPVGANPYLFAQRYGVGVASTTTTIFLSTGASVLTLSVVLLLVSDGIGATIPLPPLPALR